VAFNPGLTPTAGSLSLGKGQSSNSPNSLKRGGDKDTGRSRDLKLSQTKEPAQELFLHEGSEQPPPSRIGGRAGDEAQRATRKGHPKRGASNRSFPRQMEKRSAHGQRRV